MERLRRNTKHYHKAKQNNKSRQRKHADSADRKTRQQRGSGSLFCFKLGLHGGFFWGGFFKRKKILVFCSISFTVLSLPLLYVVVIIWGMLQRYLLISVNEEVRNDFLGVFLFGLGLFSPCQLKKKKSETCAKKKGGGRGKTPSLFPFLCIYRDGNILYILYLCAHTFVTCIKATPLPATRV